MATRSFDAEKTVLDDACEALRSFTLGHRGFTPKDGMLAIERVNAQCERMKKLFTTGAHAKQVVTVVASMRGRIAAAEARLALLKKR